MFTQFALPVWAAQLQMTRYPILQIINQGCGVNIHRGIAVGAALDVSSTVVAIAEKDNRARIHQQLVVKAQTGERALTVDFYTLFILGRRTSQKRSSQQKVPLAAVASWEAHPNDGFRFGVLTGDLNPIHWIGCIARRSPFNGKVMHGFGMFTRCFEILQNATEETIQSIDVRFVRPARLPSRGLQIMRSRAVNTLGDRHLALLNQEGAVLMAGCYRGV
jgi:acyl dehydratase